LAEWLKPRGCSVLFVDTFGAAYPGQSQNDAQEVRQWLEALDRFKTDAGAESLIVTTHMGKAEDRQRGTTALDDWPDSIIMLSRKDGDRYLSAHGRDVDLAEDQLAYDPDTRTLTLTGNGSRRTANDQARIRELADSAVVVIAEQPGLTTTQIRDRLRAQGHSQQREDVSAALEDLVSRGLIRRQQGARNAKLHYLVTDPEDTPSTLNVPSSPELSPGRVVSSPDPSYRDGTTTTTLDRSPVPGTTDPGTTQPPNPQG
jgi:hypothetical protein